MMISALDQSSANRAARVWPAAFGVGLPLAAFVVLWIDLVQQLGYTWSSAEQYAYGWFVPVLSLGLLWRRWWSRPVPRAGATPAWLLVVSCLLAAWLLPARILHEVNADWPLANWVLTLPVVALSLIAVFVVGGLPWVRHFAFPIAFILVSVRWPYRVEHGVTDGLMRLVANLSVEILGLGNVPAWNRGNLIEIDTGVLGIDEACSGIRSLQSTLMTSLFFGELYRLPWVRRFLLVGGGLVLAFCLNVARCVLLSWNAATSGMEAVGRWHDPAGLSIVVIAFLCLWYLASRPLSRSDSAAASLGSYEAPAGQFPRWLGSCLFIWTAVTLIGNELWYRRHDEKASPSVHWSVRYPTQLPSFIPSELPPRTVDLLRFDQGTGGSWRTGEGIEWDVFWFRWEPRSIAHVLQARLHRPERCLPAAGIRLVEDAGIARFMVGEISLPLRQYVYELDGRPIHVFFCLWEDGAKSQSGMATMYGERVRAAWSGRRALGQQTLEVIVSGYSTLPLAASALRAELPKLIRFDHPVPGGRGASPSVP